MPTAIITGSAGLVGSTAARFFVGIGWHVVGIDNDGRAAYFGPQASTMPMRRALLQLPNYIHAGGDIRDAAMLDRVFAEFGSDVQAVIHTAAQPSHDWAASDPQTDFGVNAVGTLNLLQATRRHCPQAAFVFCSTNKVYGDNPNRLRLQECETRYVALDRPHGIDETMSVDGCLHSLFGASKLAADVMVQEHGRYFGMHTACFRGGCLTGPNHAGAPQHGFLSYLVKCAATGTPYEIIGHGGKQVRDNIHAADLVAAFWEFIQAPRPAAVYNIGGGPANSCSVLEAISLAEEVTGRKMATTYRDEPRIGDHVWWVTDNMRFQRDYPQWSVRIPLRQIVAEIVTAWRAMPCTILDGGVIAEYITAEFVDGKVPALETANDGDAREAA